MDLEKLRKYFEMIYDQNPYVHLLGMKVGTISSEEASIYLDADAACHTNVFGVVHGGVIASLADTVMGLACAAKGIKVVTMDFNINFLHGAKAGDRIIGKANVLHQGKSTLVCEAKIFSGDRLVAAARGSFFNIGEFDMELKSHRIEMNSVV